MIEPLIQPVVNIMGLAALSLVLSLVPVMMAAVVIKSFWWFGLGDAE